MTMADRRIFESYRLGHQYFQTAVAEELLHKPDNDRRNILRSHNDEGWTILHLAIQEANLDAIEVIWSVLSEQGKLFLLSTRAYTDNEELPFHIAAGHPEVFERIMRDFSPETIVQMIQRHKNNGRTLFHTAVEENQLHVITLILTRLIPKDRISIMQLRFDNESTVLHVVADRPEFLQMLIGFPYLPDVSEDLLKLLLVTDKDENMTVLCRAALILRNAHSVQVILNSVQNDEIRIKLLNAGNGPILWATVNMATGENLDDSVAVLHAIKRTLAVRVWKTMVQDCRHEHGQTLVHLAARKGNMRLIICLLEGFNDKKERLRLLTKKDKNGDFPLYLATHHSTVAQHNYDLLRQIVAHEVSYPGRHVINEVDEDMIGRFLKMVNENSKQYVLYREPCAHIFYSTVNRDGAAAEANTIHNALRGPNIGITRCERREITGPDFLERIRHSALNAPAFLAVIMSHGRKGYLVPVPNHSVPIQHVIDAMSQHKDVPKVLTIQACQDTYDEFIHDEPSIELRCAHSMVIMPVLPGEQAERQLFIPILANKLTEFGSTKDLHTIFVLASAALEGRPQTANVHHDMTKQLYLKWLI